MKRLLVRGVFLLAAALPSFAHAAFTPSPIPPYAHGVVVSASPLASDAGIEIMKAGGNAIDGAVATAFALAVVYPEAGALGGGGFAVVHREGVGDLAFDFREVAPTAAYTAMFLDSTGTPDPKLSLESCRAAAVPGGVDGLLRLWQQQGSGQISRRALLAPAIRLARDGFRLPVDVAQDLNEHRAAFARSEAATRIFVRADHAEWKAGDLLVQTDLANTLDRIAAEGRAGFYLGQTAELIRATMLRGGGLISLDDLDEYHAELRAPLRGSFRGREIVVMPPPSSGGILLLQMLAMLERFPLDRVARDRVEWPHLFTEVARRAYADRAVHLGDPAFAVVPEHGLLEPRYVEARAASISLTRATPSDSVAAGDAEHYESDQTTHLSVLDAAGNAVALTATLNDTFGSGIVVEGAGFLLNNEMDDFSAKPGTTNLYGLTGGQANRIEPKKRPLSSMTPTLVLRDGKVEMALGSPGGPRIITSVLQVLIDCLVREVPLGTAVATPRIHAQWQPDLLYYEEGALTDSTIARLGGMGHEVVPYANRWIGRVNGATREDGGLIGSPDPRGGNAARGF
ncbi:MAG: gamma-glutamyltransferase [Candidatus Eisenbacteria bacterium]